MSNMSAYIYFVGGKRELIVMNAERCGSIAPVIIVKP